MQLTWHGHSTWHVEVGDTTFLIDPFFDNPKTDLDPGDVESPDYVLLTHGHADHVADVGAFAHDATVVGTPELVGWVESEYGGETPAGGDEEPADEPDDEDQEEVAEPEAPGDDPGGGDEPDEVAEPVGGGEEAEPVGDGEEAEPVGGGEEAEPVGDGEEAEPVGDGDDVEPDGGSSVDTIGMNLGGTIEAGDAHVTMHRADHTNGIMTGHEMDAGMPAGFVISTAEPTQSGDDATTFYHAGDTSLFTEMREVIAPYLEPDAAAVPIGDHFTMGPWQAAVAVDWLDVDYAYPMHYDSFPPIEQDPEEFQSEVRATGTSTDVVIPEADEPFPL